MKENNKKKWNERSSAEKTIIIVQLIISFLAICMAILQFLDYWSDAVDFAIPLFGVYYLLETALSWKTDRDRAAFSLIIAIFILAVTFIVFFL